MNLSKRDKRVLRLPTGPGALGVSGRLVDPCAGWVLSLVLGGSAQSGPAPGETRQWLGWVMVWCLQLWILRVSFPRRSFV